jgi:hypothetical protein
VEEDRHRSEDNQYQVKRDGTDELDGGDGDADLCGGVEPGNVVETPLKADDILTFQRENSHTTSSLPSYWQHRIETVVGGYLKPLTGREAGQLKQLHKYLGEKTHDVIAYAINNWWKFASVAGAEAAVPWPTSPHIGFLLKHHAVAVNLMQPVAAPVHRAVEVPPASWGPPVIVQETPYVLTQEELDEMLADLKA